MDWMKDTAEQLKRGAFLMIKGNPMTIGWGQFGVLWGRPTFTVYVRRSRYTHELLEQTNTFTVSVPASDTMKKELSFCGTKSGRDLNKMDALQASLFPSRFNTEDGFFVTDAFSIITILNAGSCSGQSFPSICLRTAPFFPDTTQTAIRIPW